MNKDAYRGFWIAVGVLYLLVAGLLFVFPATSTPRSIQIFEAVGGAFVGVLLIVWGTSVPAWLVWFLLLGGAAGLSSTDVYEVIQGQRHWLSLIPFPALLLIAIFVRTRDDNAKPKRIGKN